MATELVRNAESQVPLQTDYIRKCILTRFPSEPCILGHDEYSSKPLGMALGKGRAKDSVIQQVTLSVVVWWAVY